MSELDLCSRREADRLIAAGRVLVGGKPVEPTMGQKVDPRERDIAISATPLSPDDYASSSNDQSDDREQVGRDTSIIRPLEFDWERMRGDTVVLHKPAGYVSGQPEDSVIGGRGRHEPAVRLLTRKNLYIQGGVAEDVELKEILSDGNYLHFSRKFNLQKRQQNNDPWWNDDGRDDHRKGTGKGKGNDKSIDASTRALQDATLNNYVPSGRLDLESTGLLIFTKKWRHGQEADFTAGFGREGIRRGGIAGTIPHSRRERNGHGTAPRSHQRFASAAPWRSQTFW